MSKPMNHSSNGINKPFAESCEENKRVILSMLEKLYIEPGKVLEIGSGTGQHAVFFAENLSHLQWQPSDRDEYLSGIRAWLDEAALDNLLEPLCLDVMQPDWPVGKVDYIFSANTAHIMSWAAVQSMFAGLGQVLQRDGLLALYGPFNYHGAYTSDSNARFDQWLKERDPLSGIRDFSELDNLADKAGLSFVHDYQMPVNNRILVWQKR
jgi:cyclopropane fatty-acyl-phospholipid synthase-like methyltransferase